MHLEAFEIMLEITIMMSLLFNVRLHHYSLCRANACMYVSRGRGSSLKLLCREWNLFYIEGIPQSTFRKEEQTFG